MDASVVEQTTSEASGETKERRGVRVQRGEGLPMHAMLERTGYLLRAAGGDATV